MPIFAQNKFVKKNKRWLLLLIIAFPSVFWLILETSTINSRRLPFYGPKQVIAAGDTNFYTLPAHVVNITGGKSQPTVSRVAMVMLQEYRNDSYRIAGLWEYIQYEKNKLKNIPIYILGEQTLFETDTNMLALSRIEGVHVNALGLDTLKGITELLFKQKPYYTYPSCLVLIDGYNHVRGYYDARYISEVKRMTEEYKHLRLREEKNQMVKDNEITNKH